MRPREPERDEDADRERAGDLALDDGEPRVEYDLDDGAGGLRKGQRVRHPQLGRGRIEGITAWQGTVTVQFESGERRTIKAQFLRPDAEYCEP